MNYEEDPFLIPRTSLGYLSITNLIAMWEEDVWNEK
jgi:hypothetical protein